METKTAPQAITRNILQTKDGKIWLATWKGAVSYDGETFTNHTNKAGLRRHRFFTLLEDKNDHLWFGTIGAGVYRYDGSNFTNLTTDNGIASNVVECILEDAAGNLWFGTHNGVSRYDGVMFQNFTTADGLFTIQLPQNEAAISWKIEMFDLRGQLLKSKTSQGRDVKLNSAKLSAGVYLIKVQSKGSSISKRVVIQ